MADLIHTRCCIVGGGPAGMMLGFLLARMGVDVQILEKHADFLRDFRGDTIHPSTLELMYELGILEDFLKRPHQELRHLTGEISKQSVTLADFTHLPTHCKFIAFMPQWDFLDFLAEKGRRYPSFHLQMQAEVTDLVEAGEKVVGVRATTPSGPIEVRADLVVGTDGRHSTVRDRAGLSVVNLGAPMDVLWMRISQKPGDDDQRLGHIEPGRIFVTLDRGDYWQCALVIPKGGADAVRKKGMEFLRSQIVEMVPRLADRVAELQSWDQISLLTVAVDRLEQWYRPGVLCIGDAAHAMSPIGGVGINLAVQDAVATANLLGLALLRGTLTIAKLREVQLRRRFPTRATQKLQVFMQDNFVDAILRTNQPITVPFPVRLLQRFPVLRRIPARVVGMGFRPEHVRTPETV